MNNRPSLAPRALRAAILVLPLAALGGLIAVAAPPAATPPEAATAQANLVEPAGSSGPGIYIVQLADPPAATYDGGKPGLPATAPRSTGARKLRADDPAVQAYAAHLEAAQDALLARIGQRLGGVPPVRFRYQHAYNGIALELSPDQAREVAGLDGVTLVFRDVEHWPDTDTGPAFVGAPAIWNHPSLASRGEGIIVGILDTGINHDHPAFAATDADGYTHTNPFGAGVYRGHCVGNPSFCNAKLVGAWALHPSSTNPEDPNGHGSHTAATAAGNRLVNPQFVAPTATFGFAGASGVAPRANLIAYQVCVPSCPTSATTAAVNQAVIDGVDVINYSISGGTSPWVETTAVAFRNAAAAGVVVATSAGNAGPGAGTVGHQAPWVMTVAAGTHDRAVLARLTGLTSTAGSHPDIDGEGANIGIGARPMVYAGNPPWNNPLCNPFPAGSFSGQIVVCDRGVIGRVLKGQHVLDAGGGAMVLANDVPSAASLNADGHVLPAIHISHADGVALKAWMQNGSGHAGAIAGGVVDYGDHGDRMASFSSRGPAGGTVAALRNTIKPDLTGPGLNILAAYNTAGNPPPPEFNIISGTSMSSPHAAGAAALMVALRPTWTPAEIKSALVTTSAPVLVKEDASTPATPFDQGAGGLDLAAASNAGLVMDIAPADYVAANPATGGQPGLLNLPNLASDQCNGRCTWTRTVRSTSGQSQQWQADVIAPGGGLTGSVTPASFTLAAGASQVLQIEVEAAGLAIGPWHFGRVELVAMGAGAPATAQMPVAVVLTDLIFASGFQTGN
ncbi:MAG: S8 family serine peptidase [Pseudoxanthomonas sp.]|nr:S8 family serine peptidase [Pseudoxanthomonas sp.]